MSEIALSNLIAWSVQAGLLALVAAIVTRLISIDAPAVRYAWWRAVLLLGLALPIVQPWQPPGLPPALLVADAAPPAPVVAYAAAGTGRVSAPPAKAALRFDWRRAALAGIAAGALMRLAWLMAGLVRLRRLRHAGIRAGESAAPEVLQALAEAGAEVRYVPSLRQPVTFGVRPPIVLLPDTLSRMPAAIQRAVLVHELWHVRRRDWLWSLSEECLRALLWFHPAISYLVSRVQASREEVVDELSVLATNARRSYLEALSPSPTSPPSTPPPPSPGAATCSTACCSFPGRP
jgi:beta-lactamase regulating signal transducer with metallopeptidase domain